VAAVERLLDRIPDGATVEADVGPIARLTSRCRVFWVGDARPVTPRYIAIDNGDGWAGDPVEYARTLHPGAVYTVTGAAAGYVVLRLQA
jgi:hypothetical protein